MIIGKLVRDRIPELIESSGKKCKYRIITDKTELALLLCNKIIEEARELKEAIMLDTNIFEEEADLTCAFNELESVLIPNEEDVKKAIRIEIDKNNEKGKLEKHIFLEEISDD